ncbi:solute carrier family 2, facilitated glucose transporter member 8-like isoform X2 [Dermacentor silvarum]|uniref:solute carrier family 2, facilitated glucose transporter member 8-like isoform X1 n=2 Tax=Dermacentor silvarum TaxID=543639 RepID=UPI00189728F4|nr:solute carrier family 2, facilitated glucose transporter member 8-like isoform X1 [Dermacentor silvarum]XP_049525268.1 solute carrier family 2, facilitated glucose transporter member 8-like isoform X2 [Dermacentor silvarum]
MGAVTSPREAVLQLEPLMCPSSECDPKSAQVQGRQQMEEDRRALTASDGRSPWRARLVLSVCSACMSGASFGLTLSYSSPALPDIRRRMPFSDSQSDWFGSLVTLGALFGGLAGGQLVNRLGRKDTIIFSSLGFVIGFLLIEVSPLPNVMFLGRFLTGLSTGITALAVPVFVSEVSPPQIRGVLNTLCTIAVTSGVLMAYVLGKWLDYQWLATACIVPSVIVVSTMPFVADSPRWLIQRGRSEEALKALEFYEGAEWAREEFDSLQAAGTVVEPFSFADFKLPYIYKPFLCVLLGMFLQQFSGISIMLLYTQDIFESAGSTIEPIDCTIIVGVVQVASGIVATLAIDRLGRKILLLGSCFLSSVSLVLLGISYHFKGTQGQAFLDSYGWLPLLALCGFMVGYSVGLGPLPWMLMGEMLPLRVKGFATGASTAFNFGCGALTAREYHSTMRLLGNDGIYWFYGAVMALGFVLVLVFIPETRGKTLEEIEVLFGKSSNTSTDSREQPGLVNA